MRRINKRKNSKLYKTVIDQKKRYSISSYSLMVMVMVMVIMSLDCEDSNSVSEEYSDYFISPIGYKDQVVFMGSADQEVCGPGDSPEDGCDYYGYFRLYKIDANEEGEALSLSVRKFSSSEDRICPGCEKDVSQREPWLVLGERLYLRNGDDLEVFESNEFVKIALSYIFADPAFETSAEVTNVSGATAYTFPKNGIGDMVFVEYPEDTTPFQCDSIAIVGSRLYYLREDALHSISAMGDVEVPLPGSSSYSLLSIAGKAFVFTSEADLYELQGDDLVFQQNLSVATQARVRAVVVSNSVAVMAISGETDADVLIYEPNTWTYQEVEIGGTIVEPKVIYGDNVIVTRSGLESVIINMSGEVEVIEGSVQIQDYDWLLHMDKVFYMHYPARPQSFRVK